MLQIVYLFSILNFVRIIKCDMEPFIVGGKKANIEDFPHSAYLSVGCRKEREGTTAWACGASIVNQKIMLTAAHCIAGCTADSLISISVGHSNNKKGISLIASDYYVHDKYRQLHSSWDIAIIKTRKSLKFSETVKRVVLMRNPPYSEKAYVAGWGTTNEYRFTKVDILQYIDQYVWKSHTCRQYITEMPKGTICAKSANEDSFAAGGDSGSALVVRGYIQIGIVSYKMPKVSKSLVVYTDTGYFYDWIKTNSRRLYCA